jgi:hypothetical protein
MSGFGNLTRIINLPDANGVAVSKTALFNIPVGPSYHQVMLEGTSAGGGQATCDLWATSYRLKANGKEFRSGLLTELANLEAPMPSWLMAVKPVAGTFVFFFSDPSRRDINGEKILCLGTADLDTLTLEVDIPAGATTPVLAAYAMVDDISRPSGLVTKWSRAVVPITQTGINRYPLSNLNEPVQRWIALTSDPTAVKLYAEGITLRQFDSKARLDNVQLSRGNAAAAAGVWPLSMDYDDMAGSVLYPTVLDEGGKPIKLSNGNWRFLNNPYFEFTMGAATSFPMYTRTIGPIG